MSWDGGVYSRTMKGTLPTNLGRCVSYQAPGIPDSMIILILFTITGDHNNQDLRST